MKYCSNCGERVVRRRPYGDRVPRYVCERCQTIVYSGPRIVVACIAEWRGRVLLYRRTADAGPRPWAIPNAYLEFGESSVEAATRLNRESSGTHVRLEGLYALFDNPDRGLLYLIYRGSLVSPELRPAAARAEVRLVSPAGIPWEALGDPAQRDVLLHYVEACSGPVTWVPDLLARPF